jgi:homoserine O-acetyltransferase/O-succinyltransferase
MSPCMRSVLLAVVLLLGIRVAHAADWPNQTEGDLTLNDYACISGDKFATLKLHYTTIGTPRQDAQGHVTNAVLLLHGTGGTGKEYLQPDIADHLFKPGQVLDASRYYVVLPDGIGAGGSSKPSDGLHGKFPRYGYNDQVSTQQITLARLGVDHLKLVSGISMGGMQTWLWAERFPEAMDAAVPIASMPMQVSGRNLIWRQIMVSAIEEDPGWNGGNYETSPTAWSQVAAPLFFYMLSTAEKLQEAAPDRAKALGWYDATAAKWKGLDAANVLFSVRSSSDYDPGPMLEQIHAPVLAINFEDDVVNPIQLAPMVRQAIAPVSSARFQSLPGGFGHSSIYHSDLWAETMASFLDGLPGWNRSERRE